MYRINDLAWWVFKEQRFSKNITILHEGKTTSNIFLVKVGHLQISKVVTFEDEAGVSRQKNVVLLDVNEGDFVGEESLNLLNKAEVYSPYTVKVASRSGVVLYVADSQIFISTFKSVLPEIQKMCNEKEQLLDSRKQ